MPNPDDDQFGTHDYHHNIVGNYRQAWVKKFVNESLQLTDMQIWHCYREAFLDGETASDGDRSVLEEMRDMNISLYGGGLRAQ